jgi:hypothetical protein
LAQKVVLISLGYKVFLESRTAGSPEVLAGRLKMIAGYDDQ